MAWAALAIFGVACLSAPEGEGSLPKLLVSAVKQVRDTDAGLLVRVEDLEVAAVFAVERELLVCLRGGKGYRAQKGQREPWPASEDLFLVWRCSGRRAAVKLAQRLSVWQGAGASLRLLGTKTCSSLVQDEGHWVSLPKLSTAA